MSNTIHQPKNNSRAFSAFVFLSMSILMAPCNYTSDALQPQESGSRNQQKDDATGLADTDGYHRLRGGRQRGLAAPESSSSSSSSSNDQSIDVRDGIISDNQERHEYVDALAVIGLFDILTNNNDIIAADLRESEALAYQMPRNVEVCRESFASETNSAEYLTNSSPDPLPPFVVNNAGVAATGGGADYAYVQYKADSVYAKEMKRTVDRVDNLMTQLHETELLRVLGGAMPSLMFDIDNTMAYTGFNDTDDVGEAPPITETVDFIEKWCDGWGSGDYATMNCVFMTARFCTEMNARATERWLKKTFPLATDELLLTNVQFSGGLSCSCCDKGNIAYKDILRKDWIGQLGANWIASIGDQYTDSVGRYSGIRVKLPNVWFDSSAVPNQFTMGLQPELVDGAIPPQDWETSCATQSQAPLVPGPPSCINSESMRVAREHASFAYCMRQIPENAPNQILGCSVDISTGTETCSSN